MKQTTEKLELEEQEANKTLYLCFHEEHKDESFSFVVRTITLSDLFDREEEEEELQLRQVAYKDGPDLIGCCVFRSQIVIAGGVDPNLAAAGYEWVSSELWNRNVYSFGVDDNRIKKMDAS